MQLTCLESKKSSKRKTIESNMIMKGITSLDSAKKILKDLFKKDTVELKWTRIKKRFKTRLLNLTNTSTFWKKSTEKLKNNTTVKSMLSKKQPTEFKRSDSISKQSCI